MFNSGDKVVWVNANNQAQQATVIETYMDDDGKVRVFLRCNDGNQCSPTIERVGACE